ncbi:PilC/PilY family type IV pilus protein [Microbulbifer bruguierae]|uniref:PilC/PilY family type IV pilus protein n=1 Tax=Microbulbifer bruguierae TaxID=3029061 RepID=A0ABY8NGY8_9GAMM|nr:PilC/PilY family type IV pilus protein [Microbulbifer bruguierae]WGL18186.1 PilC/PilY family type IV pilus protein [Microbulbifer bruguierae]
MKNFVQVLSAVLTFGIAQSVQSLEFSQSPLFLAQPVKPIVMLNMSNDHQLYFKAYDDYTDLDADKIADTTYMNSYDYYGYFDSGKCYDYESSRFVPKGLSINHYCDGVAGSWSGNFLNWATMTRMDAVRKILYGGYRSTDGDDEGITVLERAYLPHDAHSFAKYYNGEDISQLTPMDFGGGENTQESGITLCNTTPKDASESNFSQGNTDAPEIRVVQGNYSLWASNERWQCRWSENVGNNNGRNGNDSLVSGINAGSSSPSEDDGSTYVARVEVCKAGFLESNCRAYPDGNSKPAGLLQRYGEKGDILFGLMTGSYTKNKSGGVLRKNVGSLADEINVNSDGTFSNNQGIVRTIDKLRIYGYRYSGGENGSYLGAGGGDNCSWGWDSFDDNQCSNWGNPQSEIFLEALHYIAGKSALNPVAGDDKISGLTSVAAGDWETPVTSANHCAATSIIQFNASISSYDGDTTNALGMDVGAMTDRVGELEGLYGKQFFVGTHGDNDDQLCTAKTVTALSGVTGTCPDAPRLEGTYNIAGMAYYARKNDLQPLIQGTQTVTTYGVALAPAVPRVDIPVPGMEGKKITILPACRNHYVPNGPGQITDTNCAIVDFKIVSQSEDGTSGKLYVNWEDSEQGGDFDQDMWGVIDYSVSGSGNSAVVSVSTNVVAESTADEYKMGFGYIISGTVDDGFHAHSGINGFTGFGCDDCNVGDSASLRTYTAGTSLAQSLESPLYYAAKWGGYSDGDNGLPPDDATIAAAEPSTYFYAIDPAELEESLSNALESVAASAGSASSVATSSTRLGTDTVIYQALFNSTDWSGELKALELNEDGTIGDQMWEANNAKFIPLSDRNIFTYSNGDGALFNWESAEGQPGISEAQKLILAGDDEAEVGAARLTWIRGSAVAGMRDRAKLLGDIVNSSPVFAGRKKYNYHLLESDLGGDSYLTYYQTHKQNRKEVVYVGANDGMLHAFDAASGHELFAYIPSGVYESLRKMTSPDYGTGDNRHQYSVDGPLFVGDAYFGGENPAWKNILVGTLGAGGKGIYVLDVTDPESFDEGDVMFELTDADFPQLGNITGAPIIVPTGDGWKLIFGNGYNSEGSRASLVVVDLDNPSENSLILETNEAGQNGLAGPSLLPNGRGEVIAAYAGDLFGNLWKFDLSGENSENWSVALEATVEDEEGNEITVNAPLFTAIDRNGQVQPITSTPTLGINEQMDNAVMVYFGTGSYLSDTDNEAGTTINSFYALADQGEVISGRSDLMQKVISEEENGVRTVSNNYIQTWWGDKSGWYLDLIHGDNVTGERVISKPLLVYDRLLFPTMITSNDSCSFGGSGWQMELVAVGDRFIGHSIFGVDGQQVDYAIISYSQMVEAGRNSYLPSSNIKGEFQVDSGIIPPGAKGRISWRNF